MGWARRMSSIVVLRQDERLPDAPPALWDLDATLLETLCSIAHNAAASGGARFVTSRPHGKLQTLVSARWKPAPWRPLVEQVLQHQESQELDLVSGAPVEGPNGVCGVFLLQGALDVSVRRQLASAYAGQVAMALSRTETRLTSGQTLVQSMVQMLAAHDGETGRHSQLVKRLALVLGKALDFSAMELLNLERAALLHDLGKVHVPQALLTRDDALSTSEWALIREHPSYGERLLRNVPELQLCAPTVRHHHERWNGSGYPDRLSGTHIPLDARIIALVDAYETIRAGRPYRQARSREDALAELEAAAGAQFDPTLVKAFASIPYHVLGL